MLTGSDLRLLISVSSYLKRAGLFHRRCPPNVSCAVRPVSSHLTNAATAPFILRQVSFGRGGVDFRHYCRWDPSGLPSSGDKEWLVFAPEVVFIQEKGAGDV